MLNVGIIICVTILLFVTTFIGLCYICYQKKMPKENQNAQVDDQNREGSIWILGIVAYSI